MVYNRKLICLGIIGIMLCPIKVVSTITVNSISCDTHLPFVTLDTFIVDLDKLYWYDNATGRNNLLNMIGNGSYDWPLGAWGAHFTSSHVEGVDHLYFHPYRILPIYAPHDGYFEPYGSVLSDDVYLENGTEVMWDSHLAIYLGLGCTMQINHINVLKSIYDEVQATGNYSFTEGEIIAYNMPHDGHNGFEIWYYAGWELCGGGISINPFIAFNPTIVDKIETYFNALLPRAKIAGAFPEVDMCNDFFVAINDTVWGVWEYSSGYLDPYFEEPLMAFPEGRFTTFFNRNFTNPEYYYRDPKNSNLNITDDVIGIFANSAGFDIEEYNMTGHGFLKEYEGNHSQGIMEIILNFYTDEWGMWNDSIYVRYSIFANETTWLDDILTVECFYTLAEAQAGFTANNLTYERFLKFYFCDIKEDIPPPTNSEPSPTESSKGYWLLAMPFTAILFSIIKKKKN